MSTYNYNILEFPNSLVNIDTFTKEINQSSIITALSHMNIINNVVEVIFKADLSNNDKIILDDLVIRHDNSIKHSDIINVKIKEQEDYAQTKGHFQSTVIDLEIDPSQNIVTKDITFPYPISLFSSEWNVDVTNVGDKAEFHIAPDTIIGTITSTIDGSEGLKTINVSQTVIDNISMGFHIKIGSKTNSCIGRVASIDKDNKTITFEESISQTYTAGSYVFMTVKVVDYWRFTAPGFNSVGESKIGAAYIPANTVLRIIYHNINGLNVNKLFGVAIDYMY